MQLGVQILFLLFQVCKPSSWCISSFHIYEQTPSTSLSVLSLHPFMPQSVSHLHMYTFEYSVSMWACVCMCACVCIHCLLYSEELSVKYFYCPVLMSAIVFDKKGRSLGQADFSSIQSIRQCLQLSNWMLCLVCSKRENKFCLFPPLFLKSVLCYLARTSSFSCGLTGSGNNMVIFV